MQYSRKNILLAGGIIITLFLGLYYTRWMQSGPAIPSMAVVDVIEADVHRNNTMPLVYTAMESSKIIIHIVGEVVNPGTYELQLGARVQDAVNAAGGVTEYANTRYLNLAAHLRDADHIIVPTIGEDTDVIINALIMNSTSNVAPDTSQSGLVNINTALDRDLQTLPGIGPALAGRIIDHREQNGNFASIEEIMAVPRIGNAIFEGIRNLITV